MVAKRHIAEGDTFVPGRSPEKARELLELAEKADLKGSVRTTTGGYIVPSSILDGADVDSTEDVDESTASTTATAGEFDPAEHTVDEVEAYLADADDAERERVLAAEKAGKGRRSLRADETEEK